MQNDVKGKTEDSTKSTVISGGKPILNGQIGILRHHIADIRNRVNVLEWKSCQTPVQLDMLLQAFEVLHSAIVALEQAELLIQEQHYNQEAAHAAQEQTLDHIPSNHAVVVNGIGNFQYTGPKVQLYRQDTTQDIDPAAYHASLALLEHEQTARAQAEAELQEHTAFMAIASHELKTPLQMILGHAQLVQGRAVRTGLFSDRDCNSLSIITQQVERLRSQIDMMLDIGRITTGQFSVVGRPFDVVAMISAVAKTLEPTLKLHTLDIHLPAHPCVVMGDAMRLQQVLDNLLSNAVKYSLKGGTITVAVTQQEEHVSISVTDQGVGIASIDHSQLFQRFYRVHQRQAQHVPGLGIGLYVVKEIVEAHHGSVTVASELGNGSTFTIALPLVDTI